MPKTELRTEDTWYDTEEKISDNISCVMGFVVIGVIILLLCIVFYIV